jgi:hypothetical protein
VKNPCEHRADRDLGPYQPKRSNKPRPLTIGSVATRGGRRHFTALPKAVPGDEHTAFRYFEPDREAPTRCSWSGIVELLSRSLARNNLRIRLNFAIESPAAMGEKIVSRNSGLSVIEKVRCSASKGPVSG